MQRIQPGTRTRIADATDAVVAAVVVVLMVLAAIAVLTGSTALGFVPAPSAEPPLVPTTATNTTIGLHAVNPYEEAVSIAHRVRPALLSEKAPNKNEHLPGRR